MVQPLQLLRHGRKALRVVSPSGRRPRALPVDIESFRKANLFETVGGVLTATFAHISVVADNNFAKCQRVNILLLEASLHCPKAPSIHQSFESIPTIRVLFRFMPCCLATDVHFPILPFVCACPRPVALSACCISAPVAAPHYSTCATRHHTH